MILAADPPFTTDRGYHCGNLTARMNSTNSALSGSIGGVGGTYMHMPFQLLSFVMDVPDMITRKRYTIKWTSLNKYGAEASAHCKHCIYSYHVRIHACVWSADILTHLCLLGTLRKFLLSSALHCIDLQRQQSFRFGCWCISQPSMDIEPLLTDYRAPREETLIPQALVIFQSLVYMLLEPL